MSWDTKDYVAVGAAIISSFSLAISYITFRQKNDENWRAKRKEFRETIVKLDELISLTEKMDEEVSKQGLNFQSLNAMKLANDQKVFYLKHAESIAMNNKDIAETYEYLRMAIGFQTISWDFEAEQFFHHAIDKATDSYTKAVAIRSLARFLYRVLRSEEGQDEFYKCLSVIENHDRESGFVIETYRIWALVEYDFNDKEEAKRLIDIAETKLDSDNRFRRSKRLRDAYAIARNHIYSNV